jgi:hypothetical protein
MSVVAGPLLLNLSISPSVGAHNCHGDTPFIISLLSKTKNIDMAPFTDCRISYEC